MEQLRCVHGSILIRFYQSLFKIIPLLFYRKALEGWESSLSKALPGLSTPLALTGVSACLDGRWHAVVLHVRPCHGSSLRGGVCQEDCVRLMSQCAKPPQPVTPQALYAPSSLRPAQLASVSRTGDTVHNNNKKKSIL